MDKKKQEALRLQFDKRLRLEAPQARDHLGCTALRWRLVSKCPGYIISDKIDKGQDAPSRVEMGNPKLYQNVVDTCYHNVVCFLKTTL